ncbi:MAG: hypothetical protein QNJ09_01405 [Paracoccaceae bacterium]|nr:hypothetical protein [Paracoccaceae bacterium]
MANELFHAMAQARARNGEDPLVPFLLGARKNDVAVSARDVPRLDAHRLQILLVAERQWAADGVRFRVTDQSPSFCDSLERLGLDSNHFDKEATT